ncbi:MAG: glycosyltransferase family 4 protein [Bacteroidales bacterium]|nr:glycosyltransferase family 4 protein [Bacteroidales bacterium]MDZ4205025.1 glycosyltransferase family 4 protein [Bacteroidales bacterium]
MRSKKLKILMLANKMPYPPRDGGAIATLSIATNLADLSHTVTMLVMNTSKHHYDLQQIPDALKNSVEFISVDVNTDISVRKALRNYFVSSLPYNAERFISADYDRALGQLLASRSFDVIHLEGPYLGPYIRTIRKHTMALVSMRPQNIEHEIWQRIAVLTSGLKKPYIKNLAKRIRRFETSMINNYDVLVPITHRDADIYRHLGCRIPIFVASTGIDANRFIPDFDVMEYPSLFHLGALDWAPNQEGLKWFFSRVWPRIHKEFPSLKFYLAGRNAPPYFRKLSEPNVEFLGEVESAHDFIRSKAIMVVPLFSGSGLRIKIIEGMALGKAIITTNIGKEGIECSHMRHMMIADRPDEFLEAVRHLVTDRNRVVAIGQEAAVFVNTNYNNTKIINSLAEFYIKHLP